MKIIIANTNIQALLKATDSVIKRYGEHDVPDKIKGQANLSALKSMFSKKHFSVCDVDSMATLNNVKISEEHRALFQTLHCVNFEDMTEETREYLFAICVNYFRNNIVMANSNV
jgi:hypothetical protein